MKIKGQITYQLRDADTLELLEERVVDNLVTENYYDIMSSVGSFLDFKIVMHSKELVPGRWLKNIPANNTGAGSIAVIPDSAIPSVAAIQLIPAAGATPAYVQASGRYNTPAGNRTFKTVILAKGASVGELQVTSATVMSILAAAKLNTPCAQTTSQVLDVYYRLFLAAEPSDDPRLLNELLYFYSTLASSTTLTKRYSLYPTPVVVKRKAGDEALSNVAQAPHRFSGSLTMITTTALVAGTAGKKQKLSVSTALADNPGTIYCGMITGGSASVADATAFTASDGDSSSTVLGGFNLTGPVSKIQNLIGHGSSAKPMTASPWLDVDNLPNGTGRINLSGSWVNRAAPSALGLYAKTLLPQWNTITITASGQVSNASATYKYTSRPFFGYQNLYTDTSYTSFNQSPNTYTLSALPSMCATGAIVGGNGSFWHRATADAGKTLPGNIATAYLDTRQISAAIGYDETSFVFVKKNMLILYSIGAGDYWNFAGAFTNITQVAVVNHKIYVACRNTGLYVIDPKNSLNVVSLSAPGAGIDLSACYGVAKGYNSTLWAVGVNGLAKLDAGVWSLYNSGTVPAFSIAGVSDNNYANIDYLKVDELSATFQMHLVRRVDASVDATKFGVWWSTATPATNSFTDVLTASMGRPRVNRTHFGGYDGLWAVANQIHKVMAFGSTAPTAVVAGNAIADSKLGDIYASVFFVKNAAGAPRLLTMHDSSNLTGNASYPVKTMVVKLIDGTGAITDTVTSGLSFAEGSTKSINLFGKANTRARSSAENAYGSRDCAATFILTNGVMVTLWCGTENQVSSDYGAAAGTVDNLIVGVSNYATDLYLSGGALAYLSQTTYGWTGGAWVENAPGSKPVHSDAQALRDGVSVYFTDGAAGTSFVNSNYYKFGCCEGLLKDNATRHLLTVSYYTRQRRENQTELGAYFVPELTALNTGVVTALNPDHSSTGAVINVSNQVVFASEGGGAHAAGDKQVTGDFEINYDVTGLTLAEANMAIAFGVGKSGTSAENLFGFLIRNASVHVLNGAGAATSYVTAAATTALKIKRVGGVLTAWINGIQRQTNDVDISSIRLRDDRLDLIVWQYADSPATYSIANRRAPAATISINGSDCMVYVGNPVTKTGAYGPRFCGIDADLPISITLNGVAAVVRFNGVAPAAGEVCVDPYSGALYFNTADAGKSIAAQFTYIQTE